MNSQKAIAVVATIVAVCVGALGILLLYDRGASDVQGVSGSEPSTRANAPALGSGGKGLAIAERKAEPEPGSPTESPLDSAGVLPDAIQAAPLRLAIETTMVGQIDPGGFLDTALALSKLEVRKTPIPEPTASGAMRYPILGTPEGVSAELWVKSATNTELSSPVMTYHVNVQTPDGYVFEGAARKGLEVQISLWTDKQGNVKNYGVLTDSMVSGKSRQMGLGWENRTIATGALFSFDAASPYEWTAKNCVLKDGTPVDSADQPPIVKGQWPRLEDLKLLKNGLLNQYSTL